MSSAFKKISLVLSIYNEESCIGNTLLKLKKYMRVNYPDCEYEFIVVDDGSTDNTVNVLEEMKKELPELILCRHSINMGQGKGFQTAFDYVTGDVVLTLDADLSYEEKYIGDMLTKLEETDADIVIASAFLNKSKIINVPLSRRIMTICANKLLAISSKMNVSAITCAVRAYRKSVLDILPLESHGMEINLEVILKAEMLGLHIEEIPAVLKWNKPSDGTTKRKKRRSYFNLIKSIFKYSFFSMLFNPSWIFILPQLILVPFFVIYAFSLGFTFFSGTINFMVNGMVWNYAVSNSLRNLYATVPHGFIILLASVVLSMLFFLAWFISAQNKFYFEQNHILLSRLLKDRNKTK